MLALLIAMVFAGVAGAFAALVVRTVWLPDYRRSLCLSPTWNTIGVRSARSGLAELRRHGLLVGVG